MSLRFGNGFHARGVIGWSDSSRQHFPREQLPIQSRSLTCAAFARLGYLSYVQLFRAAVVQQGDTHQLQ
jgi:hypothetical protein